MWTVPSTLDICRAGPHDTTRAYVVGSCVRCIEWARRLAVASAVVALTALPGPALAGAQQPTATLPPTPVTAPPKTALERWAPVAAQLATVATASFAMAAGYVGLRKYAGSALFHPAIWITVEGSLGSPTGETTAVINLSLENKGVRSVVVRGDSLELARERDGHASYVSIVIPHISTHSGEFHWHVSNELPFALDDQARGLWVHGEAPSPAPRPYVQTLAPGARTELPFVLPAYEETPVALVRAQIWVEDINGRHGSYVQAEKVLHAPQAGTGTRDASPTRSGESDSQTHAEAASQAEA